MSVLTTVSERLTGPHGLALTGYRSWVIIGDRSGHEDAGGVRLQLDVPAVTAAGPGKGRTPAPDRPDR
jgi:hypothetical protein